MLLLFDESQVGGGYGAVILAESIIGREGSISFWEFGVWIVSLKSIQNIAVLVEGVA